MRITTTSHPIYDDKAKWASEGVYKPPEFGVKGFQKRLNEVVGLSPSGAPIVKLSWAWDVRKWENTEWGSFGNATKGEWRQKYRALSVDIGNDDYVDISPPRWILEERYEPEAIAISWELTRYRTVVTGRPTPMCPECRMFFWPDPDRSEGHLVVCKYCSAMQELDTIKQDTFGSVPREGWYNLLPHIGIIAHHRNHCCKKAWLETREICYGEYREPDNLVLKRLKKAIQLRNREMATNPHIRPELDPVGLNQAKTWGLQMMQDTKVRKQNELAEIAHEHKYGHLNRVYV